MSKIPADIEATARDVVNIAEAAYIFGFPTVRGKEMLDQYIARAILAERARAAKVAHEWMHENGLGANAADVALEIMK